MFDPARSRAAAPLSVLCLLIAFAVFVPAASATPPSAPDAGPRFSTRPRSSEPIFAEEDVDVEFFLGDNTKSDPVLGPAPVIRAKVTVSVTMPAMPGMGAMTPAIHEEGQPGYYGMVLDFPHGGEYQAAISFTTSHGESGTVTLPIHVQDARPGQRREKPYSVSLTMEPKKVRSGEPAELSLTIKSRKENKPVREFEVVHEMLMHLLVVSKDLRTFEHVHPDLGDDGAFRIRYTFPYGGDFLLFADVTPKGAGQQVLIAPLKVEGAPAPGGAYKLAPTPNRGTFGGMEVSWEPKHSPLRAHEDNELVFTLKRDGNPVTDLAPWLGALGHLVLIHEDSESFVHSHPAEQLDTAGSLPAQTGQVAFLVRFKKPGLYKGWAQFNTGERSAANVVTVDFVVRVESAE